MLKDLLSLMGQQGTAGLIVAIPALFCAFSFVLSKQCRGVNSRPVFSPTVAHFFMEHATASFSLPINGTLHTYTDTQTIPYVFHI